MSWEQVTSQLAHQLCLYQLPLSGEECDKTSESDGGGHLLFCPGRTLCDVRGLVATVDLAEEAQ